MIPSGLVCCLGQRMVLIRPDESKIDGRYLLYVIQSPTVQHEIRVNEGTGSTVSNLRIPLLEALRIPSLPLPDQRRIGRALGVLDDKIELNRRMSETLEAIARALFRSWFVDFDPVRAKAEGRDAGLAPHLADLFSESIAESPLGGIPRGWSCVTLGDHVEAVRGLSYNGAGLSDDGVPLLNLNSIYEGGGFKPDGLKRYTGAYESRHTVAAGDVIVANTEQGHHRLLIGFAAIVPSFADEQSIYSHHLYRVRPRPSSPLTADYLCHLFNSRKVHDVVSGYANGTTVNMLPADALSRPFIVVPPAELIAEFDRFARLARQARETRRAEAETLAALRDTLLPKLISGELRVRDAERLAETVF
jgi:type I restriction enzyme, S subunit